MKNASYILKEIQLMFNDTRAKDGWVSCMIAGLWVEALVFNEPSKYGLFEGRVSRLCIGKNAMRDRNEDYSEQCQYQYDRKDIVKDETTDPDLIKVIVTALEKLPHVPLDEEGYACRTE